MVQKEFQELDLKDVFLFVAALKDTETCQLMLELIMGRPIGPVSVQVEHGVLFSRDFRYVRFDVYASDVTNVFYDMEIQNSHKEELPRETRYHQAEPDTMFLESSEKFQELPTSYVIFTCTYDPFHSGFYRYTYEERCEETGECPGDETYKIYLNMKGTSKADVSQELIHFLKYVEMSTDSCVEACKDEKIRKLYQKVEMIKKGRRLEESYMTMGESLENRATEGKVEGKAEERQLMLRLVSLIIRGGLTNEIDGLSEDEDFCNSMLEKYHLQQYLIIAAQLRG